MKAGSILLLASALAADLQAQFPYPPKMDGARTETYKTIGDAKLDLHIFSPAGGTNAPGIVFFFGGGWTQGSPQQFEFQCRYLASRGMVAIAADYRVKSRQGTKPVDCVADARSAMRWVRANAGRLGIDPNRLAAGGGSAGGHLAACTAFITECDDPIDDKAISAEPNALVLFNPALVLAPLPGMTPSGFGMRVPAERLGTEASRISPASHVKPGAPPAIIFHGRADQVVPFATVQTFTDLMKAAGNRCELFGYAGQAHGFFNKEPWRTRTLAEADRFFASLGWITGPPTLNEPVP